MVPTANGATMIILNSQIMLVVFFPHFNQVKLSTPYAKNGLSRGFPRDNTWYTNTELTYEYLSRGNPPRNVNAIATHTTRRSHNEHCEVAASAPDYAHTLTGANTTVNPTNRRPQSQGSTGLEVYPTNKRAHGQDWAERIIT